MLDVGDVVRLTAVNLDSNNNPVDAAVVAVVVTQPDGTTLGGLPAPTRDGVGSYHLDVLTVQPGRHVARWLGTDPVAGFAQVDTFNVWPLDPHFLISLADAKSAIGRSAARSARDEDLRLYVAAASAVIENITGPLATRQCTETFDGGTEAVLLSNPVAAGVVTVTEAGTVTTSCVINAAAGIVYAGAQSTPRTFAPGRQTVSVSYPVGVQIVPSNLLLAVREELRFLWQIGQESMHPGVGDDDTEVEYTPSGFAVPRRVVELCAGSTSLPGFA